MIEALERILNVISNNRSFQDVPYALTKDFPALLFTYLKHFRAWKSVDVKKLTSRLKHALVGLYNALAQTPEDSAELRTHIERLREKLSTMAGPEVLRKFDEERVEPPKHVEVTRPAKLTKEQLTHELLIDPAFQLNDFGGIGNQTDDREAYHNAFWASLADDIRMECYVRVMRVFAEIRNGLINMGAVTLDLESIKRRVCCDFRHLMQDVTNVIQSIQMPKRQAQTAELYAMLEYEDHAVSVCKGLAFLLGRVNALQIDEANMRLQRAAPTITNEGVDYERNSFAKKLSSGNLTLDRTRTWLHAASSVLGGMLDLVMSANTLTESACPETLLLDVDRIRQMQAEFFYIVSSASFLVFSDHAKTRDMEKLSVLLAAGTDIKVAAEHVPETRIFVPQACSKVNPVYQLMSYRIRAAYHRAIDGKGLETMSFPKHIQALFPLITQSASNVKRVLDLNKRVHEPIYTSIFGI